MHSWAVVLKVVFLGLLVLLVLVVRRVCPTL
jgi:hypothetical protein